MSGELAKRTLRRVVPWLISALCFLYLYGRIQGAASAQGLSVAAYLGGVFASVDWIAWLAWMVPYSFVFFAIDTAVLWRCVSWWNARVSFASLLPVRASAYILSILNEQVGKGAIALYLNRREGVPGWELGSTMLVIMFCEFLYLLGWASFGILLRGDDLPEALAIFRVVPWIGLGGIAIFIVVLWLSDRARRGESGFLSGALFASFRRAVSWQYLTVMALRSPALLAGVLVYSRALALFGVETSFAEMLPILPVIFFGTFVPGPFRAVAVSLWPTLFPENPGAMAAFGFVQHNFFVLFNGAIGLAFLPRANRELFGGAPDASGETQP